MTCKGRVGFLPGGLAFAAALALPLCAAAWAGTPEVAWSAYLGGAAFDHVRAAAADRDGNLLLAGYTASAGWTANGWDTSYNGGTYDGFVIKLSPSGAHLWSTYLGGSGNDQCHGVAVDADGIVLVTGISNSTTWTSGGWNTVHGGGNDAFAVKLDPNGGHLWSSYLGAAFNDHGHSVAADSTGNVYITGQTCSPGWVSGGWKTVYLGSTYDGFIVKLSPSGAHLWSSFLGGAGDDYGKGVATDHSGNVLVTGYTTSTGWTSGGWDTSHNGGTNDGFVLKLSASGAHLWSTYLGGANAEEGFGVAVDTAGNVFAVGNTMSPGWVSKGWDSSHGGDTDGYLAKLSPAGAHLWSTFLGANVEDLCQAVAVDGEGNALVTGHTNSDGWTSGGWNTTRNGNYDAFAAKFSAAGTHLWSSYLGGTGLENGYGVAAVPGGGLYAAGRTDSAGWVGGGWDTSYGGAGDGYAVLITESFPVIAIGITPEAWHIGPRPLNHTETSGVFTLANTGNTAVEVTVSCGAAAGGWTLQGVPGTNAFSVALDKGDDGVFETVLSALEQPFAAGLPAPESVPFRLRYCAPDADTLGAGAPQDFTVTFRASMGVP